MQQAARRPTCSEAVKDSVLAEDGMAVGADQHACLSVPEDVVLLQQACRHNLMKRLCGGAGRLQPRPPSHPPRPPLKMQMPPSLPSWILLRLSVGLLSVLIHTPAMALSKISLSSMKPRPARRKGGVKRARPRGGVA